MLVVIYPQQNPHTYLSLGDQPFFLMFGEESFSVIRRSGEMYPLCREIIIDYFDVSSVRVSITLLLSPSVSLPITLLLSPSPKRTEEDLAIQ